MALAQTGHCPSPFLPESLFHPVGGFVGGCYCEQVTFGNSSDSCCLPCPLAEWRYDADLNAKIDVASWISVAILPLGIFLLVSYAVLPVKWTHRHYLSICFTLGICCMELAFIIPLGTQPEQCYNAITPNDMHSNFSCAVSGSFLLFGGWMVVIWSFIRTIAFHLQVCWEVVLGTRFMWMAFIFGFGIPAIGLAAMLVLTGVSFRFGKMCHINVTNALYDYWIPVMVFATAALLLQVSTMIYCTHIYLRALFDKSAPERDCLGVPCSTASVRTVTTKQAYRRIRRVLQLQWRGVALVFIIIANVIFFAVVFINLDHAVAPTADNVQKATPWLICLARTGGDRESCRKLAAAMGPNESTLLAVVILLSLVGFWNFILFARPSMFVGWMNLFRRGGDSRHEFVSADANHRFGDHKGFEMLTASVTSTNSFMQSPSPTQMAGHHHSPSLNPKLDCHPPLSHETRSVCPSLGFSGSQLPILSQGTREWDPRSTFAPGYGRG